MRRPERVAETLREEISELVGYELDDPRIQSATVTDVVVSGDLRDAKVFVLVEGEEKEIKEALSALQKAAPYIRRQIAFNLNLHHAPHLHFARDTVEEKGNRIDLILEQIKEKVSEPENVHES